LGVPHWGGHVFPSNTCAERGVIYFCQGFLPCMMPSMDGWWDEWADGWVMWWKKLHAKWPPRRPLLYVIILMTIIHVYNNGRTWCSPNFWSVLVECSRWCNSGIAEWRSQQLWGWIAPANKKMNAPILHNNLVFLEILPKC